jgi:two-component system, NtrC family, sensor histidine kinase HydH
MFSTSADDLIPKLKKLIWFRILFTAILLGSSAILQLRGQLTLLAPPLLLLYSVVTAIFLLSAIYSLLLRKVGSHRLFAFVQVCIDTAVVSVIIFVTGNFSSIFSFLYLLVIIYASMLLFRRASMIIAALCSIQYGILIDLEYLGFLAPFGVVFGLDTGAYHWSQVLFKIVMVMAACFTVAFLSNLLAEQERKTKAELATIKNHVKRVEKLALMGEMAAGMAHEIKNPLASISGAIQLLKEDIEFDPGHDKLMRIIMREADRLSALVNNFLLFARPPAGKSTPIDLAETLREIVSLFVNDCACSEQIVIEQRYRPNAWVKMDPHQLRQVLWNLLLNALEAIKENGTISISTDVDRNRGVRISVADSGPGIKAKDMGAIFDPFFTTKPNGTGLGLSIAHSILESYQSRLDVESTVGRGTRFTFGLPTIDI